MPVKLSPDWPPFKSWGPATRALSAAEKWVDGVAKSLKARADVLNPAKAAYRTPVGTFWELRAHHPEWFHTTPRTLVDPLPWPSGFDPQTSPVYAHNELVLPASPAEIFERLARADQWPALYANASDIQLPAGEPLRLDTQFEWVTFGMTLTSRVTLHEPERALGWTMQCVGTEAFQRWLLYPDGNGATRVVTEECQRGATPKLIELLMNPGLHAAHQLWLEGLGAALANAA